MHKYYINRRLLDANFRIVVITALSSASAEVMQIPSVLPTYKNDDSSDCGYFSIPSGHKHWFIEKPANGSSTATTDKVYI